MSPPHPTCDGRGDDGGGSPSRRVHRVKRSKCTSWKTLLFKSVGTGGSFFSLRPSEVLNGDVKMGAATETLY